MLRTVALAVALSSALSLGVVAVQADPTASTPTPASGYPQEIQQWRQQRLQRLTAPDGWLSLIGLEWLKEGANRIGSAADNDIVLKAGPAHLGVATLDKNGTIHLALTADSGATIDGKPLREAVLVDDMHAGHAEPTSVRFGTANFYAIDRDGRKGLRVKDSNADTRTHFLGLDYFPTDPSWRIEADWVPFDPPHELEMGSVLGTVNKEKVPGKAVFQHDGHTYELLPIQEDADSLFFVLADRTSGRETYGAARFLSTPLPHNGKLVLDFNKATNPPCAFTPFATCPLAPPENRLDVAVTAGEKNYRGSHH